MLDDRGATRLDEHDHAVAGPMGSYAPFSNLSTLVMTALMYLGRLEIIPVLVLFTASHWRA